MAETKRPALRQVTFTGDEAEALIDLILQGMGARRKKCLLKDVLPLEGENLLVKVLPRLTHGGKPEET